VRDEGAHDRRHAELLQRPLGLVRKVFGIGRQNPRASLEQEDLRVGRTHPPEVVLERVVRDLRERARHFDARRSAADDDEVQPRPPLNRVARPLRPFEGVERLPPDERGVLDRLQAGRVRFPVVAAEVAVGRAGRYDEQVVRNLFVLQVDDAVRDVDRLDLSQQDFQVSLTAEEVTQRRRDVGRRESARRNLVEQRLEQVKVPPIE
jgi:hypothetical protein